MSRDVAQHSGSWPRLDTLTAIRPLEGQRVIVVGRLSAPGRGKDLFKIVLKDRKRVAIGHFSPTAHVEQQHLRTLAGKKVAAAGRVYFDDIPGDYQIFARIGIPYLVDILTIDALA